MKNLVLGIALLLGLTNLGYSQKFDEQRVELEDVRVSTLNNDYLHAMGDEDTPESLIDMHRIIASYDIKASDFYEEDADRIEVDFRADNGSSTVFYDANGKIIKAYENYKNVIIPPELWREVYDEHRGWSMVKNKYSTAYYDSDLRKCQYKLFLSDGNDTKKIVLNLN